MRELLEEATTSIESPGDRETRSSRRSFLHGITSIGLGLVAASWIRPTRARADESDSSKDVRIWRDYMTIFVFSVCEVDKAKAINSKLARAEISYVPNSSSFHDYFSSPYRFDSIIEPQEVICGNGFEVKHLPYYDVECPCRGTNDINASEIKAIIHPKEIERFGCVLAPASRRTPVENRDHAIFSHLASAYNLNPNDWIVTYKRIFTGKGRARFGYQIVHKTKKGENGRPLVDVLLSDEDF